MLNLESLKCSKCLEYLPKDDFTPRPSRKRGYSYICKVCMRMISKESHIRNKESRNARLRLQVDDGKEFIKSLKSKPCVDCGIQYPYYVMEFFHKNLNNKLFNINYNSRIYSQEKIQEEAEKCDLVCSNCNRVRENLRRLSTTGILNINNFKPLRKIYNTIKQSNTSCKDCMKEYPPHVLDFDHVIKGSKKFNISQYNRKANKSTLINEINKCEIVCSNCHRVRTHNRNKSNQ